MVIWGSIAAIAVLLIGGLIGIALRPVSVEIRTNPPGATIRINNEVSGASNLSVKLRAGTYQVAAEKDGYVTRSTSLVVEGGSRPPAGNGGGGARLGRSRAVAVGLPQNAEGPWYLDGHEFWLVRLQCLYARHRLRAAHRARCGRGPRSIRRRPSSTASSSPSMRIGTARRVAVVNTLRVRIPA